MSKQTRPHRERSVLTRLLVAGLSAVCTLALLGPAKSACAQQGGASKKSAPPDDSKSEIPPPREVADDEWLTVEPFDRLIFNTGEVYDVEPDSLEQRPLVIKVSVGELPPRVRVRVVGAGEENEVLRAKIKEVKHFEDMLFEQGQKLLLKAQGLPTDQAQVELNKAFDLITRAVNMSPRWPGIHEKLVGFWYAEAVSWRHLANPLGYSKALSVLRQMREYCREHKVPEHPDTRRDMGQTVQNIVTREFEEKNYVRGRPFIFNLEDDYPGHEVAARLRKLFIEGTELQPGAEKLRQQAKQKEAAGQLRDACLAILEAADIWPTLPGLEEDFARIFNKYPILHVAVRELPDRFAPWAPPGTGDARVAQLLHVPMMEVQGVGEKTNFNSRLLTYQLSEGGRRVTFNVKPGLIWSDGEKPITAADISRSIAARCDSSLAAYDAALKSALKSVTPEGVNRVVVDLKRFQLRPEVNFLFNLAAGHRLQGDSFGKSPSDQVGAGPFRVFAKKLGSEAVMQANPHFFGGKPKISEIVERRYPGGRDAANALLGGDVALLEHVPPKQLKRIEARKEFKIVRSGVPALHAISFDFRAKYEFSQTRTLRRAMAYAIDRKRILEDSILDAPSREGDELVNGPFPKGSFAFDPTLEPWYYDPVLAKGLASAAREELRTSALRFELQYPDTEEARTACEFLKEYWQLAGIQIVLKPRPPQALEEEIALGRRFELVYRILYVRDPVLDAARVLCLGPPISPKGEAMPNCASPWLRQSLRELELATNWKIANDKLHMIQQQARDDVAIIPLWQLTDTFAFHERLHGFVENKPLGFYQDAENWQIDPWFRKDAK